MGLGEFWQWFLFLSSSTVNKHFQWACSSSTWASSRTPVGNLADRVKHPPPAPDAFFSYTSPWWTFDNSHWLSWCSWYPSFPGKLMPSSCFSLEVNASLPILSQWFACDLSSLMSLREVVLVSPGFLLLYMWKQPLLSCMLYLQAKVKMFKAPFSCSIKCAHHNTWNMARAHKYKFTLCFLNLEGFCSFKAIISKGDNILRFPIIIYWQIAFSKMLVDNFWQQGGGMDVIFHY